MDFERKNVMKALTTITIEKVLLNIGKPVLDKVKNKLKKEYKCYIPDCYDHPEYLESVLKSIFGNSHITIVESIREELLDHFDDPGIKILIETICH